MGRHAKPAALKLIDGNPGKRRIQETPDVELGIPPCPEHLSELARAEWNRITPLLLTAQLISPVYMAPVAAYCDAWGEYVYAHHMINRSSEEGGGYMVTTPNGYSVQSQWLAVKNKAFERMMKTAGEMGLTQSAMARIAGSAQMPLFPESDPMEALLRAQHGRSA